MGSATAVLIAIGGCATSQISLQPNDVPRLYGNPGQTPVNPTAALPLQEDSARAPLLQPLPAMSGGPRNKLSVKAKHNQTSPETDDNSEQIETQKESDTIAATSDLEVAVEEEKTATHETDNICTKIDSEITMIDTELGAEAIDAPPQTPPTSSQKVLRYLKNVAIETLKGPLQPVIQSVRAVTDADEKERARAESIERGSMRRAYLLGYREAHNCPPVDEEVIKRP